MLTREIIKASADKPFHLRSDDEMRDVFVSSESRWRDAIWNLDNPSIGQRPLASKVTWAMRLPGGTDLIDPLHAGMLGWLRRFAWSLFVDPRDKAKAYKVGNGSQLTQGLRVVVPWLVEHGHHWPHEICKSVVQAFLEDLPGIIAERLDDEDVITESSAYMPIKIFDLLWRQRTALADAGVVPMPERPWAEEKGANTLAKRIATEARGWIKPLPDEVAIPIVNKAAFLLGTPADDVIRLRADLHDAYYRPPGSYRTGSGVSDQSCCARQREAAFEFVFSNAEGDGPWTDSLVECETNDKVSVIHRARSLVSMIETAACIVIQTSTGMRSSEICALRSGVDKSTGLPRAVRVEKSSTGLNEVFVLRSELSKHEESPREVDWLLGMRPFGSDEIPLPVRAMVVLDRLLKYERSLAQSPYLLISFSQPVGFPRSADTVSPFRSAQLNSLVKFFVEHWVDLTRLPDESAHRISENDLIPWKETRGKIIRPSQFRKTYAQFALSVDTRLLPAVQRQFHHVNMAMTEGGYWGRNPIQIEPINAVAAQLTAMQLFELATGRTRVAGKGGRKLEQRIDEVQRLIAGLEAKAGWQRVVRFVRDNSLHMWYAPPGTCFPLNPSHMECHKAAGTRPIGLPKPNYSTREPSLCTGCDCFILDLRHAPFWEQRYVSNMVAYQLAVLRGQGDLFRVALKRAEVSRKVLQRIGIDLHPLDDRVESEVADARQQEAVAQSSRRARL